jgi:hypothetical protein
LLPQLRSQGPLYALVAGRDLKVSAVWDGECLVYDRGLGDLFVIEEAGCRVLQLLSQRGPMDPVSVAGALDGYACDGSSDSGSDADELLLGLEANGLIEKFSVDCCGPDAG